MTNIQANQQPYLYEFYGTEGHAICYISKIYKYMGLSYLLLGLITLNCLPDWLLLLALPPLLWRWILILHELFHLRRSDEVDWAIALMPMLLSPFSLSYREQVDIHHRHHAFMATPRDPDYYQLQGKPIPSLLRALAGPEWAYFTWIKQRGMDLLLLRDSLARVGLFLAAVILCQVHFLWFWLPLRLAYGLGNFVFFYCLHRQGQQYGVYPLYLSRWLKQLALLLVGREGTAALMYHDAHHANPKVAALHLARVRQ